MNKDFHGISISQIKNSKQKEYYKQQIDRAVPGKTVIDLGAGSGILSFMCILSGASKVFAIEKNKIICIMLNRLVNQLGWQDKIIVVNQDFIKDDISMYLEESDVCVSEIINASINKNISPYIIQNIKEKYKHLKIIPDTFCYQFSIIENKFLDEYINWGYDEMLNSKFDKIYLNFAIIEPLILFQYDSEPEIIIDTVKAIDYQFQTNLVTIKSIDIPKDRKNKWLKIYWHFDGEIFDNYWQCEFIPLSISWFSKVTSITLTPKDYFHKITNVS